MSESRRPRKRHFYLWRPADWLVDPRIQRLTLEQRGAYRELVDIAWHSGRLPADPDAIARLLGFDAARARRRFVSRIWAELEPDFPLRGGLKPAPSIGLPSDDESDRPVTDRLPTGYRPVDSYRVSLLVEELQKAADEKTLRRARGPIGRSPTAGNCHTTPIIRKPPNARRSG
jgi:hypothetical protein